MFVIAAPAWSLIRVMWYSNGPGNASNCHPKSEPQNSRPLAVSSAGISKWTGWPGMVSPLASWSAGAGAPHPSYDGPAPRTSELSALPNPGRSEDLGEALPPAWMGRAPAEFALGLGVGSAAALSRHHHGSLAGEDPGQPAREATGRLRPDDLGQLRQPHPSGGGLVVDDVVDGRTVVVEREHRRLDRVVEVDERPHAFPVADDRELPRPHGVDHGVIGVAVEAAVAQGDPA